MLASSPPFEPAQRFTDIQAATPQFEQLQAQYDEIGANFARAGSPAQGVDLFRRWDALRRAFATWAALAELRFQQDTKNQEYKAEVDRLNELRPKINGLDVALKRKFLGSPLRPALEKELGSYVFERWELDVTAFDPAIEPLVVTESQLENQYTELLARADFTFNGERLNLPTISKYAEHPDRQVRRQAAMAKWQFFSDHREELDRIYDELVQVRHRSAKALDFHNFIELGYRRMMRTDYGPSEVARYREAIVREIVPLAQRIVDRQAQDLGVEQIMLWDEQIFGKEQPPKPPDAYDGVMTAASEVFASLGDDVGSFAGMMVKRGLVDLQSREGKAGGGFCTSFPTYGLPYIFANFNGTTHDVNVLLHEMGHAYQAYASRTMPVSEYLWPTLEACEVHSTSMEFLSWPQLEYFFGDDAERYRIQHLKSSLLFLPYGAAVDHFQHFVYEFPDATPDARNSFWLQLEAAYLPWRRYGGIEHLERGGYWQQQRHIYAAPFYYIDYTLAICCALQFWARSLDDYDRALTDYRELCKRGGELPFQALVRSAGLQSPFEEGVLRYVAGRAAEVIAI